MVWVIDHTTEDVPPVVEGDFEWDSAKAESNIKKHGVSFFEAATVCSPILSRFTSTMALEWARWWSSEPPFVSEFYMSFTSSGARAIGSSAPIPPSLVNERSTRAEEIHEPDPYEATRSGSESCSSARSRSASTARRTPHVASGARSGGKNADRCPRGVAYRPFGATLQRWEGD